MINYYYYYASEAAKGQSCQIETSQTKYKSINLQKKKKINQSIFRKIKISN